MLYFIGKEKDWPESVKKHLPHIDGQGEIKDAEHYEGPVLSIHAATLYELAMFSNPKNIIEVGRRNGESTRILLDVCLQKNAFLWSIDIKDSLSDLYPLIDKKYHRHYKQLVGDGTTYEWPFEADFIFIDTMHTYKGTLSEADSLWKHLKSPGIMAIYKTESHWGAKKAVFEWAEKMNLSFIHDTRGQGISIFIKPNYSISMRDRKAPDCLKNEEFQD